MPTLSCIADFIPSFDGEKLSVVVQGNLSNPSKTFILLSGLGGGITAWSFICEELLTLRPDIRCIVMDMRGHSSSSHVFPANEQSFFEVLAKDIAVVCEKYDCKNPILVGHSLGGLVLQTYLQLQLTPTPQKTVLICTPMVTQVLPEFIGEWAYKVLSSWSNLFKHSFPAMSIATHLQHKNSFDFSLLRISHDIVTVGLVQFVLYWLCILSRKGTPVGAFTNYTVELIFGTRDLILPKFKQNQIRSFLPDSQVATIDSCHNAVVNEPAQVGAILAKI
jgi:pimeloyl-ACP methyl ester carboxylesterase